jgi:catechol 2,3-dioxygenase-like lactoylglutathione lyase family enzyme
MKRVTGLGGVFFKTPDPDGLKDWYRRHLGIESDPWGFSFFWRKPDAPEEKGYTVWSPFPDSTKYFAPSAEPYMINYRVDDLEALLAALAAEGVEIVGGPDTEENGKFAWILDPEGRKIELWEPVASARDPYVPKD